MLTVKGIAKLKDRGLYGDSRGLYLSIARNGSKSWIVRYRLNGKRRDLGLGPLWRVSLAEARQATLDAHKQIAAGVDPVDAKHDQAAGAVAAASTRKTFDQVAALYIDSKAAGWRDPTNTTKWRNTLRDYASPVFGGLPVDRIETGHVKAVLEPIWTTKTETASRVRQRIEAVLDYAKASGYRSGEANPARWAGHLENVLPKPSKVAPREHMESMPYKELPGFMGEMSKFAHLPAARALEFAILTAARSGEVLGATWGEIDLEARTWMVPANRIKAGREHRVPLPDRALEVLGEPGEAGERVFPLGPTAMRDLLAKMGKDVTVHGFRSTFRVWAAEQTNYPREIAEQALAHVVGSAVEQAYQRSDLFAKRRQLMAAWSRYCADPSPVKAGEVVAIRA